MPQGPTDDEFADEMSDSDAEDEHDSSTSEPSDPFEELCSTLNLGERLSLSRSAPAPEVARGHLCTMDMPASRSGADLMDIVQKRWGGGTFIVRRQAKLGQKSRWLKGAAVFQLAGPPLMDGRPIDPRTGEIVETPRAEVLQNPMMYQPPASAPAPQPDPNVIGALTQALIASRDGGQPLGVAELVALAQQLTPQPQPQQPRTPLAEIKQYVGFLGELKDLIGGGSRDESPSESMGIPKTMEDAFLGFMKQGGMGAMMGGGQPQPSPSPSLPTYGPPGALWDPAGQRWVPGPSESAPSRPAPPQTPTPNPGPPPPPTAAAPVDDEWEEEPITPELVVETLQGMGAAEARDFVARVQSALGPAVVDKFAKSLADD